MKMSILILQMKKLKYLWKKVLIKSWGGLESQIPQEKKKAITIHLILILIKMDQDSIQTTMLDTRKYSYFW